MRDGPAEGHGADVAAGVEGGHRADRARKIERTGCLTHNFEAVPVVAAATAAAAAASLRPVRRWLRVQVQCHSGRPTAGRWWQPVGTDIPTATARWCAAAAMEGPLVDRGVKRQYVGQHCRLLLLPVLQ